MATENTTPDDGSTASTTTTAEAPVVKNVEGDTVTSFTVDTPVKDLTIQPETSGPTNPQVKDGIVNPSTVDSVVDNLPKTKNEFGVEQVIINEDGSIKGL